ncbi:MAG: sensor histidine kinase [Bacteroidota bacterium]
MNLLKAIILSFPLIVYGVRPGLAQESTSIHSIPIVENTTSNNYGLKDLNSLLKSARSSSTENIDSALYFAATALKIAQENQSLDWEAESFRRIGITFLQNGDYSSALHYLFRSEEILLDIAEPMELRRIYNNIGVAYQYSGRTQKSIVYYLKSLEKAEAEKNLDKQLDAIANIGGLSTYTQQYKNGLSYIEKGIALAKENKKENLLARFQLLAGTSSIYQKEFEQAEKYLHQAEAFYLKQEETPEISEHLGNIYLSRGVLEKAVGDLDAAGKEYKKSLEYYQKVNSTELAGAYLNLGNLAFEHKRYLEASDFYEKALEGSKQISDLDKENLALLNLAFANIKLGNTEKAYDFQYRYVEMNDSLNQAILNQSINQEELLFEQARSDRREEATKLALARQRTFTNYLLAACSIVALIAVVFFLLMRLNKQRQEVLEKELTFKEESNKLLLVEMLKDHEVENLNAMLDGQEHERKRIARDLHDSLGGTLAAVQLTLASLERKLPEMNEKAQKAYDKAENLLDQAYQQMRGISHNLADLNLKEGGLSPALAQLKATLSENTQLDIKMDYNSLGNKRLDSNVEQHSYRITQELFQNIIKHAEASTIEYELNYSPIKLQISIKDNGKGFAYEPGSKVAGIGLNNIMTRVRQLEGEMEIQSKPGEGTKIEVDIPLVLS